MYNIYMVKLTKKQIALLNFIDEFTKENSISPTYREIMAGLNLSSVSAVAEHIDNLVEKGVIKKVPGAARSLELVDFRHEETVKLFNAKLETANEEEQEILKRAAAILELDLSE